MQQEVNILSSGLLDKLMAAYLFNPSSACPDVCFGIEGQFPGDSGPMQAELQKQLLGLWRQVVKTETFGGDDTEAEEDMAESERLEMESDKFSVEKGVAPPTP